VRTSSIVVILACAIATACTRGDDAASVCASLRTGLGAGLLPRSAAVKFVARQLEERPWSGYPKSLAVFRVAAGRTVLSARDTAQAYLLYPQWRTDARPFMVVCHAGSAYALAGFPRSDGGALLRLGDVPSSTEDDSSALRRAVALAALLDTGTGDQLVLGLLDSTSAAASTPAVARQFGLSSLTPVVAPSLDGELITVNVSSANRWGAIGLPDFIRFRFQYARDGSLQSVDRVVVAGQSILDRSAPDSLRFGRQ